MDTVSILETPRYVPDAHWLRLHGELSSANWMNGSVCAVKQDWIRGIILTSPSDEMWTAIGRRIGATASTILEGHVKLRAAGVYGTKP